MGPIVGSTLYEMLGYAHTFFIYGAFLVFLSFIIKLNFPEGDYTETDDEYRVQDSVQRFAEDISSFQNELTPQYN